MNQIRTTYMYLKVGHEVTYEGMCGVHVVKFWFQQVETGCLQVRGGQPQQILHQGHRLLTEHVISTAVP